METDPLQQLRDVHTPLDPSLWPPAIGWWVLAILVVGVITFIILRVYSQYQRGRPIRAARQLIDAQFEQVNRGDMTAVNFLHESNEILKRVLVPGLGRQQFASLTGDQWLKALDEMTGTNHFTQGGGQILGNERFTREPSIDPETLYSEVRLVLDHVTTKGVKT